MGEHIECRSVLDLIPRAGDLEAIDFAGDREAWLAGRRRGIGGSEVAAILGVAPPTWNMTPLSVYGRKIGVEPDGAASWDMEQGTAMEPAIAARWARAVGADLYTVPFLRDRGLPHRVASLDRLAVIGGLARATEVKWAKRGLPEVPDHYLIQVQWYLGLTGLEHADLVVGEPWAEPYSHHIAADPELFAMLTDEVDRFWRDHIEARIPPAPSTPGERKAAALGRLPGAVVEAAAGTEAEARIQQWHEAREAVKAAEAAQEEAEAAVLEAMAQSGASRLLCGDGTRAALVDRKGSVRYAEVCKVLGVADDVLDAHRGEPSRYLRVTPGKGR